MMMTSASSNPRPTPWSARNHTYIRTHICGYATWKNGQPPTDHLRFSILAPNVSQNLQCDLLLFAPHQLLSKGVWSRCARIVSPSWSDAFGVFVLMAGMVFVKSSCHSVSRQMLQGANKTVLLYLSENKSDDVNFGRQNCAINLWL
jgi:hypothetical protein